MIKIKGFPGYTYNNNIVYNPKGKKQKLIVTGRGLKLYKLKRYDKSWVQISESKLKSLVGEILELPQDAKQIKGYKDYFIDTKGNVYSFSKSKPNGMKLKSMIANSGYLKVSLNQITKEIHTLVANAFIMEGYAKKGLCVLHKDDNKLNCNLDNLSVGTYSRNNKDAYKTGCQPSKRQTK